MQGVVDNSAELAWQRAALRRSAIAASARARRDVWVAGLSIAATGLFGLCLLLIPGALGLAAPGLEAVRPFVEQTRSIPNPELSASQLQLLSHPLWLLLSRYSSDLGPAALVLNAVSAVTALFLAYQLCHGLATPERADEQACFALVTLALTPSYFLAAAGGGTELPYLALVLLGLLCVQRALQSEAPLAPMALAGLLFGLSL